MKIDKSIIFLIVLAALILSYFMFFYGSVEFNLRDESVSVNIYDTIDLREYIFEVKDNNKKNLNKKVKITANVEEPDKLEDGKLYIGDFSSKTVTYTLKYKFKTYTKTLEIRVIDDPNDPNFKPNYDYKGEENKDDAPNANVNNNLNNNQKKYLETLR